MRRVDFHFSAEARLQLAVNECKETQRATYDTAASQFKDDLARSQEKILSLTAVSLLYHLRRCILNFPKGIEVCIILENTCPMATSN